MHHQQETRPGRSLEALVLRPHPDLARASALLPSQRFASAGHHNDWDWLALFGDIHRTGTPLERPRRAFALASLLKQLRLEGGHVSTASLATICASTTNERERSLAADCLGELGGAQRTMNDEPPLQEEDSRFPPSLATLRLRSCRAVARALVDDDATIAKAALETMRHLSAASDEDVRRSCVSDAHSALVLPFLSDASIRAAALMDEDRHQDRQRRNDDIEMDAGPFDGEIWKCRDEKWSCRVAGALLRGLLPVYR